MTTRDAIAIVRDFAPTVTDCSKLHDALLTVAAIAEHHAERNRKNKRRQMERRGSANGERIMPNV